MLAAGQTCGEGVHQVSLKQKPYNSWRSSTNYTEKEFKALPSTVYVTNKAKHNRTSS